MSINAPGWDLKHTIKERPTSLLNSHAGKSVDFIHGRGMKKHANRKYSPANSIRRPPLLTRRGNPPILETVEFLLRLRLPRNRPGTRKKNVPRTSTKPDIRQRKKRTESNRI